MWGAIKGVIGSIFSSGKALEILDEVVLTKEEKAKLQIKMLAGYSQYKIAQRVLAFGFCGMYLLTIIICLVLHLFKQDITAITVIVDQFKLGYIVLTIVGFYFGGGFFESKNRKDT